MSTSSARAVRTSTGTSLPVGADPPADLEPVHARQPEVEDDQVGALVGAVQRRRSVGADVDVVALAPQRAGQRLGDGGVVLGQQHSGHVRIVDGRVRDLYFVGRRATAGAASFSANARNALRPVGRRTPWHASSRPRPPARWRGRRRAPSRIARLALRSPTGELAAIAAASSSARPARLPGRHHPSTSPSATGLGGRQPARREDQVGRPRPAHAGGSAAGCRRRRG